MIETEETLQQRFEKLRLRRTLSAQPTYCWKEDFKDYVNKIIKQCLVEKESITSTPYIDTKDEKDAHVCLHRLQCLVAGAIQEWELVQQPDHAFIYCT